MRYSFTQFLKQFPTDDSCLEYVLKQRFPHINPLRRVKGRKAYFNRRGRMVYPLVGTIFDSTATPLTKWFYAIYLFSNSKNGVAAKEMQRQLGVTYKCAWKICAQIRKLMKQERGLMLSGVVEADETYIGGTRRLNSWTKSKVPVVGMVERGGKVKAKALSNRSEFEICPFVERNLKKGSTLYTDGAPVYNSLKGYNRATVIHTQREYVRGDVHTNHIEGFWAHFKRSLRGTHASVSKRHLQSYLDEAVFRYNHREGAFAELLSRI